MTQHIRFLKHDWFYDDEKIINNKLEEKDMKQCFKKVIKNNRWMNREKKTIINKDFVFVPLQGYNVLIKTKMSFHGSYSLFLNYIQQNNHNNYDIIIKPHPMERFDVTKTEDLTNYKTHNNDLSIIFSKHCKQIIGINTSVLCFAYFCGKDVKSLHKKQAVEVNSGFYIDSGRENLLTHLERVFYKRNGKVYNLLDELVLEDCSEII